MLSNPVKNTVEKSQFSTYSARKKSFFQPMSKTRARALPSDSATSYVGRKSIVFE